MELRHRPLISVIIPSYNRCKRLEEALASVYPQEGAGEQFDMEIIVVDDASSDSTPEIIQRHPEVRYIRLNANQGMPAARNIGVKASTGKYVAFLDDDDLWLPYKLALLMPVLEAYPEIGVAYGQLIIRRQNRVSVWPEARNAPSGSIFRDLLRNSLVGMTNLLVRREAFEKAGYFDESLRSNVDYDMALRLAFHFDFKFVPGPVAIYRSSKEGAFLTAVAEERLNYRRVVEKGLAMLPPTGPDYPQVSREARARVGLRLADSLEMIGDLERMRGYLLKALQEFPWIANERWARSWVARKVRRLALAAESPISAAQAFSEEVRESAGGRGLKQWWGIRRLLGDIWAELALGLRQDHSRRLARAAGHAALRAVLQNPAKLGPTLLLLMLRAIFNPYEKQATEHSDTVSLIRL